MSGVEILRRCNITFQDGIHDEIDLGQVIIQGPSGNAVVTVSGPNWRKTKLIRVDQLREASFVRLGETYRITGRSNYLRNVVRDPEDTLVIDATPTYCKDCNK